MSVIGETSQPSMGPYVLVAAAGLALYAWTAVCRELLSVKVAGHTPKTFQAVPYLASNSALPAHAQRMRTLFVLDSAVPCQVERGAHGEAGTRGWVTGGRGGAVLAQGVARERTSNMSVMSVTLDVSHLDMSALNCDKPLKRLDMSVTAETSQLAMGPYVRVAAVASAVYSWAAVCRELLSAKA